MRRTSQKKSPSSRKGKNHPDAKQDIALIRQVLKKVSIVLPKSAK